MGMSSIKTMNQTKGIMVWHWNLKYILHLCNWHMILHEHCWLFSLSHLPCFEPRSFNGFISHSISSWKYEIFLQHGNKQIMSTHHQHGFLNPQTCKVHLLLWIT